MPDNATVVFPEPKTVRLEDRPVEASGEGELLVETSRTVLSTGTELTVLSGEYPGGSHWDEYGEYPFTPGYCNVGEVITHRVPYAEAPERYLELLEDRSDAMGVVLEW